MSDKTTVLRQLKIKSGVAKRYVHHRVSRRAPPLTFIARLFARSLYKEQKSYVVEAEQQKIKLDKFVADGAENWDIKNAVSTYSMVACAKV